jgi:hypothetical protein
MKVPLCIRKESTRKHLAYSIRIIPGLSKNCLQNVGKSLRGREGAGPHREKGRGSDRAQQNKLPDKAILRGPVVKEHGQPRRPAGDAGGQMSNTPAPQPPVFPIGRTQQKAGAQWAW